MSRTTILMSICAAGLLAALLPASAQQAAPALRLVQPPPDPPVIGMRRVQKQGLVTNEGRTTGWTQSEMRHIDNDAHKAYVLLSPGGRGYGSRRSVFRVNGKPVDPSGGKDAAPEMPSAGLLVVLPPADGDGTLASQFWAEVMRSVLKGRYYVAVAVAPKWADAQPTPWPTQAMTKQVKGATYTTETFVQDIVSDVSSVFNIDPQRVYLHGAAESGLAVYACSLTPQTPFKGFYIHDAPFRAGQLPPLAAARGRRYFLQQSQDDKTGPLWMAEAARKMLSDKGATVKVAPYHGMGTYNFADNSRWDRLGEAITWLEAGSQPIAKTK